jgi:hypothetical protein
MVKKTRKKVPRTLRKARKNDKEVFVMAELDMKGHLFEISQRLKILARQPVSYYPDGINEIASRIDKMIDIEEKPVCLKDKTGSDDKTNKILQELCYTISSGFASVPTGTSDLAGQVGRNGNYLLELIKAIKEIKIQGLTDGQFTELSQRLVNIEDSVLSVCGAIQELKGDPPADEVFIKLEGRSKENKVKTRKKETQKKESIEDTLVWN